MAVNYATSIKNARLQVVRDGVDGGSGPGVLQIGTLNMGTVLANIPLDASAFNAPVNGQMTLANVPRSDNDTAATGKAESARIIDGDGVVIADGLTVGLAGSGANVILSVVDLLQHQRVDVTSGAIYHG